MKKRLDKKKYFPSLVSYIFSIQFFPITLPMQHKETSENYIIEGMDFFIYKECLQQFIKTCNKRNSYVIFGNRISKSMKNLCFFSDRKRKLFSVDVVVCYNYIVLVLFIKCMQVKKQIYQSMCNS